MVPSNRLASAYGLFTATFETAWFLGSFALGVLYGVSRHALVDRGQVAAIPLFIALTRQPLRQE